MKWMRKEKIVDAGWSVHFVMTGIIWTAAGALECPYSNLEEFDFYIISFVASYKCRLQKLLLLYCF